MPSTPPVATPKTTAWITFERNLDMLAHMFALSSREMAAVHTSLAKFSKTFDPAGDLSRGKEATKVIASLTRYLTTLQPRLDRFGTATQWQAVVLVTCVEAYLQDILEAAADADPELMSKSEQTALYADVLSATSLDDLASEMRRRWARRWLSDGGPTRWISRLERMGVRGYPSDLTTRLEFLWGMRHLIVHSAGVATADFLRRHPGAAKAVGDRVRVTHRQFEAFFGAATAFLEPTDKYFLARYPALLATSSPNPVK